MSLYKTIQIIGITNETPDCKTFFLQPEEGLEIPYKAGQFLTLVFPKPYGEERRSYSISSTPVLEEPLSITIKKIPNGEYSRKLVDRFSPGDKLITIGAGGFFILPEKMHDFNQFFFIAAGSGITPIFSLIKTLLYLHPHVQVTLIYSNRSPNETIFYETLHQLRFEFQDRFAIEWLFSGSLNLERARLSKWLLGILLKKHSSALLHKTLFYICGPYEYMRKATIELLEDGVPAQNIRKEIFFPLKPLKKNEPPDKDSHLVELHLDGRVHHFVTRYPQTILQAGKNEGIPMPYSCEAGKCGSCAATCLKGKIWMAYNEVLLDEEIAKGRILTCQGYAVGGDVVLQVD